MQDTLKIALVQADLVWENAEANKQYFTRQIKQLSTDVDLILLPEMFTSGFTMNAPQVAETMAGETISWMKTLATKQGIAIAGSLVIKESDKFYNRLVFVNPDGSLEYYNKRHTFTLAGEDKVYASGDKKLIVDFKGWKICPLICYDLRFPVWARNTENYDVLIYLANWPKPRIAAWDALLKARAIENMSYCIGVNRVGTDNLNLEYSGSSAAYNVLGDDITGFKPNEVGVKVVTLTKDHINTYREKLRFLNDKDTFEIN